MQDSCKQFSTLCHDFQNQLTRKVRFKVNTKIGPVLEVTTSYLQGKYAVEIKIESVNKDNSHSWVRISHGLNKLVTDFIDKEYDDQEQEASETKTEIFALKTEVFAFASRSKAKQNQEDLPLLAHLQELFPFVKEYGLILNQELNSIKLALWQKKNKHSSSTRRITSRRRWCDQFLETIR